MTRCCPHSKLMDDPRFRQRADPGGVPSRWPWRGQDCCLPVDAPVGFGSGCPDLSSDHHYTFFGIQFRGLCPRLSSASHTVSRRSHFGSATDPVASLWSGGIGRLSPTHPLGNKDEFQGVSPLFQCPGLLSARASGLFGDVPLIVSNILRPKPPHSQRGTAMPLRLERTRESPKISGQISPDPAATSRRRSTQWYSARRTRGTRGKNLRHSACSAGKKSVHDIE